MKHVTATEARKDWFRLLDEVAAGEVVRIPRGGQMILLSREEPTRSRASPDYKGLVRAAGVERADEWGWEWAGPEGGLTLRELAQK